MGLSRTAVCCVLAIAAGVELVQDPGDARPVQAHFLGRDGGRSSLFDHVFFNDASSAKQVVACHAVDRVEHFGWKILVSGMLVGCIFGTVGSGGSIVSMVMLHYVFHQHPLKLVIFEMYFVLLFLSVFGAVRGILANAIAWRYVLLLWLSSAVGTSVGAYFARFISSDVQLLLFAGSTIIISGEIFRKSFPEKRAPVGGSGVLQCAVHPAPPLSAPPLRENSGTSGIAKASLVATAVAGGVLCGVIGVGGGSLITSLMCSYGHDLKTAVPTSHTIMFTNAIVGIAWYSHFFEPDSTCVDTILIAGMAGCGGLAMYCFEGMHWNAVSQQVFAAMLFVVGVAITVEKIAANA